MARLIIHPTGRSSIAEILSHAYVALRTCGDGPEIMKFGRCGGRLGYKATDLEGERLD